MHKNFIFAMLAVFMLVFLGSVAVFADYGPGAWEQKTRSSNTVEELSGPLGCSPMFLVTPTTATNSTLFLQNIAGDLYLTDNAFYSSAGAWTAAISTNKSMALAFDLANGTFKFNYAGAGATPSFSTVASIDSTGAMSMASLTLTGALSVEGNTDLGNAAADTITMTGVVDSDLVFIKEVARTIKIADTTTATTAGAALTVQAGYGTTNGGNLVLRAGDCAAGTDGVVQLGITNTSAITVGATGITTTNAGALAVTEALTANGDTDIGNAAADTLTITASIDGDVSFIKEVARTIKVATSTTTDTSGAALTIEAGDGVGTGGGGNLVLRAGNAGSGTDGILQLGVTDTSAISIGTSGITTTNAGPLTASETLTATSAFVANGDVDLGNAATDTVTITGVIDGDVAFLKEVNRTISVAASTTTDTSGASLTVAAADGVGTGNGGNMVVRAGNAGSGTDGVLQLGVTNTSAITLGTSGITTTSSGPLTSTETLTATAAFTANGDVDLGNAASDTVTVTGTVDSDVTFVKEVNRTVKIAASTTTDTSGSSLTIAAGDGVGTGNGGNTVVNAGNAGSGTDGQVQIGAANTSSVAVTPDTTFTGAVTVNGNTDLGNAATDTCTITAAVDSDVTFIKEVNRTVSPAQSTTTNAAGANLTVAAAAADGNGAGGSLTLNAGDSPSGTDGNIAIGAANTNAVQITPATNVVGNFAVNTTKLTVNASTGNTAVAGDLNVTGALRALKYHRTFDFDEAAASLASTTMNYFWTLGGSSGTAAVVADENGIMQLSTTATGSRAASLTYTPANFNTNNAPEFIAYVQVNDITNTKVELGWYVDTNDELLFRFDTDVDAGNIYLVSENNNGGEVVTDTGVNLTGGTYFKFRLKINADETFTAEINDVVVAGGHAGTIRQLATFKPYFYNNNKAAAEEKLLNIDYVFLSQDR